MAMGTPRIGYRALLTAAHKTLWDNKATLNANLIRQVQRLAIASPEWTEIARTDYPAVLITRRRKSTERGAGLGKLYEATVLIEIWGFVAVLGQDREDAETHCEKLADNIEAILRENPGLGGTVTGLKTCLPTGTEFGTEAREDAHLAVCRVDCEALFFLS